eukprot:TRINITY_DN558_c0_g1_i1.p1 TRINITY_DN558_c0_g1~~TRINITY_DN558_c0_g1_i1.p1  ORF type:complete len:394 (+),score=71.59 TRINITY_DN558_c0_g1_i1:44-1183(+)
MAHYGTTKELLYCLAGELSDDSDDENFELQQQQHRQHQSQQKTKPLYDFNVQPYVCLEHIQQTDSYPAKRVQGECSVCLETSHLLKVKRCGHCFCVPCLAQYCEVAAEDRNKLRHRICYFRKTITNVLEILSVEEIKGVKCPEIGCKEVIRQDQVFDILTSNAVMNNGSNTNEPSRFEKYINRMHLEEVERRNRKRFASYDCLVCNTAFHRPLELLKKKDYTTLRCRSCQMDVCGLCLRSSHHGMSCEEQKSLEKQKKLAKCLEEREKKKLLELEKIRSSYMARLEKLKQHLTPKDNNWIQLMEYSRARTVITCPVCSVVIERDGGCNHMHCTRCDSHFDFTRAPQLAQSDHSFSREGSQNAKDFLKKNQELLKKIEAK